MVDKFERGGGEKIFAGDPHAPLAMGLPLPFHKTMRKQTNYIDHVTSPAIFATRSHIAKLSVIITTLTPIISIFAHARSHLTGHDYHHKEGSNMERRIHGLVESGFHFSFFFRMLRAYKTRSTTDKDKNVPHRLSTSRDVTD